MSAVLRNNWNSSTRCCESEGNVFFTTPNKYFPFETHTNAFFLHWNNALFHWWCDKTGRSRRKQNLRLLSYRSLKKLMQDSNATSYTLKKDRFMGITMTITVICKSDAAPSDSELRTRNRAYLVGHRATP